MPVKHPSPADLEPIERASQDELRALQLQRLRDTLTRAYAHVPHYRQAFDAKGVHPGDLNDLSDLRHFPFTTKQDLRDHYPFGLFAVPRQEVVRIHASSGTTGKPTVVGYTRGTSTPGPTSSPGRCARPAPAPGTSCMWPMATACSPAVSVPTTAPSGWAAPSFRCPAGRRRNRSS